MEPHSRWLRGAHKYKIKKISTHVHSIDYSIICSINLCCDVRVDGVEVHELVVAGQDDDFAAGGNGRVVEVHHDIQHADRVAAAAD